MNRTWLTGLLAAALIPTLVACAVPEEDFPEEYGKTVCKRLEECDRGDYEESFSSDEECQNDLADVADTALDLADLLGEQYNEDLGRDFINELRTSSCEEFDDIIVSFGKVHE